MAHVSVWQLWRLSLKHRPLLWLTPLCVLGCWAGMRWALSFSQSASTPFNIPIARDAPILLLPLLSALGFLFLAARWRNQRPQLARFFCGLFLACALSILAARRVLPPRDDVSFLVRQIEVPQGAIEKPEITVRGWVADFPKRGEFNTQFPLQCAEADWNGRKQISGRVWMTVPRAVEVEVGDAIQVQTELADLPRPGNFGERENWMRFIDDNCWCVGKVSAASSVKRLRAPPLFAFARLVARARTKLLNHYETAFERLSTPYPRATSQLLTAMAFGEGGLSEPLPKTVRDDFRAAGMSHILVASGTQVSFIVLIILGSARVLGVRRWPLLLVLLPVLMCYAFLAGGQSSIWRATLAGICITVALLQGRDVDALTLWCTAFLVLLWIDPAQLFNLSFQLSFGATWGLIVVGPVVRKIFTAGLGRSWLTDGAAFSLAAQAGVAPLAAYHFGKFSLAGIGANLVGVPLAGVLVGTATLDFLLPFRFIHLLNFQLAHFIAATASAAAKLPGAQLEAPPLRLLWTVFIYGALMVSIFLASFQKQTFFNDVWLPLRDEITRAWARRKPRWKLPGFLAVVIVVCGLSFGICAYSTRATLLQMTMLDVGQGESIFIRSPAGRTVLVDGGTESLAERGDVGRSVIVPFLQAMNVKKLDALVITHADADHCNGLLSVVREVPVGMVLDGAQTGDVMATEYLQLRRELALRKIPVVAARGGQSLNLGAGAVLKVLAPILPNFRGEKSDNNNAAVLKLEYGKTSVMLTADIERETEERLVRRGINVRCTILKVAHHGSKTSTQELFLRASHPQAAIISCGRYNRFGHPNGETLRHLANRKIPIFRTDVNGAIEVSCDENSCWVQTMR